MFSDNMFDHVADIDECTSNPCQNAARCMDLVNGYDCICPIGYTGTYCEISESVPQH